MTERPRGPVRLSRIGFLLVNEFPMITFAAAIEPLRAANELRGSDRHVWTLYSEDGETVRSSSGVSVIPDAAFDEAADLDALFVLGGRTRKFKNAGHVHGTLRTLARHGLSLGAISGGVFVLADAGLLNGYRCSVHWYFANGFRERYPDVEVTNHLFEVDRQRYTCAGGTATLDMMLNLMSDDLSREVRQEIARWFQHKHIRGSDDVQESTTPVGSATLNRAMAMIDANLEFPITIGAVAKRCRVSNRQLERLFKAHLGVSPAQYYMQQRLVQARQLLRYTALSVSEVSIAVGFSSQSHFSSRYRRYFGLSPRFDRTPLP